MTSVASGHEGGNPTSGLGQPAVPPLRTILISAWPPLSATRNAGAAKAITPATSSSLMVSVAVFTTVPALGADKLRFSTLSVDTTLLSMIGTVKLATAWLPLKVTVPVAVW